MTARPRPILTRIAKVTVRPREDDGTSVEVTARPDAHCEGDGDPSLDPTSSWCALGGFM
jgi:hypothetical protein